MAKVNVAELADEQEQVKILLERFKKADSDWYEIRKAGDDDLKFYNGQQYDQQQAMAARAQGNKVQLRLNMLAQYVQQVDNARRQKNISLTCHPTDINGSQETAEVIEGLFRHCEDISSAKHAYNSAFGPQGALVKGLGCLKLETDYVDKDGFDQEIYIKAIEDGNKVLWDFNAKCPMFEDAEYLFEFDSLTKDDFKAQYPDAKVNSFPTWHGMAKKTSGWVTNDTVRVAKYWYKEKTSKVLYLYEDGTVQSEDEEPPLIPYDEHELRDMEMERELTRKAFNEGMDGSDEETELPIARPANVIKTRLVDEIKVKWVITNGYEILEQGEWHNSEFPFVPCKGTELVIDGVKHMFGITRYARDPQMVVNYLSSELVRKTAATTKSQWMIDTDAVPTQFRKDWMSSNVSEKAVLFYTSKANGRDNIPPPQRIDMAEPQLQQLLQSIGKSMNDIKQTVGLSPQSADAMMGLPQNNQSGIAVQTLAEQGEQTNFHFTDNEVLAMKRLGELYVGLIPYVLDTPRIMRVIGADSKAELIAVNQVAEKDGKQYHHDLTTGKYGVVVDTGPGFASKKAMMSEQMIKFAQIDPELMGILAADIVRNTDWDTTGSMEDKIVQWQAFKFPWLQPSTQQMQDVPPQAKAAMVQLQTQLQQANLHVQTLAQEVQQAKQREQANLLDNQAKIQIEQIKQQTAISLKRADLVLEMQKAKDEKQLEMLRLQIDHLDNTRAHVLGHVEHINNLNQSTLKK